jgi:coenzyme Q-binding protein COQ10
MAHLKDTILINAPVEKVDEAVRDPHKWSAWIVGMSTPTKISGDGGVGTTVEHRIALMWGIRRPTTTKVAEERHDPDGSTFWRWESSGPPSSWWSCHHQSRAGKTLAVTELDYTMPWGVLGKACDRLFVAGAQKRSMRQTMENVKRLAEKS